MKKQIEGYTENGQKGCRVLQVGFKKHDHRDVAEAIHSLKERGIPLCEDETALAERHADECEAVVLDHTLFALACVEAAYNGDHNFFNSLHLHFNPKDRAEREIENLKSKHRDTVRAVIATAKALGKTPTAVEVADHMKSLGKKGSGFREPDQIKKNLHKAGFEKLPSDRGRGRPKNTKKSSVLSAGTSPLTSGKKKTRKSSP